MAPADLDDLWTALLRERHPGRVVEVGQAVEELDAAPLALEADDRLLQGVRDHSIGVDGYLLHIGLVRREDRQGSDVRGRLGQDDVAGIDEELGDDVDGLLGASRDDDVLRIGLDALEGHDLGDLLPQSR